MLKIALGAGHGINTPGKRCMKALDPKETREWVLNDRICDYVEDYLEDYQGYTLMRLDDSDDGEENVVLANRVNAANKFDADFYLSVHHNAGINGGSGGGIEVYVHPNASAASKEWQADLYDALIDHTGLKGNRSKPKAQANYYVLKHTKMPAVLLELGFMDSKTDVPVILTADYAKKCAKAIVEVLVKRGGLKKRNTGGWASTPTTQVDPARSFSKVYAKTYTVTASALNLRKGPSTNHQIFKSIKKGEKVTCYGYYTKNGATTWLLVKDATGATGYCSSKYLK